MNAQRILVTGATGNVGFEVIKSLIHLYTRAHILAGVRDVTKDSSLFLPYNITTIPFDFLNSETFAPALKQVESLFLLRPPQISDIKYFDPLIKAAMEAKIRHIVFLSVQGVEKSTIIPHHKIEALIVSSKIPYTFLRPAYFMQNFTSTLHEELVKNRRIYLPAGNARITLVDVRDIGETAAIILTNPKEYLNKGIELTCEQKYTFKEMAKGLTDHLGESIQYTSPNLLQFFIYQRRQKVPTMLVLVMIMLHYLPRFQKEPDITHEVEKITGKPPKTFDQFIDDNKEKLLR